MTFAPSEPLTAKSPTTERDWKRVREIKHQVLTQDPKLLVPEDYPEVRAEVLLSWKRSMLYDVDPTATDIPLDKYSPQSRLAQVAQPIMNRLEDQISDLRAWGFLTDRSCRLLTVVVGDSLQAKEPANDGLRPGRCFLEEHIGTNGIGVAHERQQATLISGSEHFREDAGILTTTGVIIRDPFTKRFVGTLGLHSYREYNLPAVLPWVIEIGRSIETQLASSRADSERALFEQFLRIQRRFRGAVIAISKNLYLANSQARGIVADADEELLRRIAEECSVRPYSGTIHRRTSSGLTIAIRVTPVEQARRHFAAVLALEPVDHGTRFGGAPVPEADLIGDHDFRLHLDKALEASHPVLLTGEAGVGKHHLAVDALDRHVDRSHHITLDGSVAHLDPEAWLRTCLEALADVSAGVIIRRVEELQAGLGRSLASYLGDAKALVVGTTTEGMEEETPAVLARESFPVSVAVPPLRERSDEFAQICHGVLRQLSTDQPVAELNARALSALAADDWPGNVRQLRQVLTTAHIRRRDVQIRLGDLPQRFGNADPGRMLGHMERVERQTMNVALRESDGNRNEAAQRLGISRATLYRKIKRYGLH